MHTLSEDVVRDGGTPSLSQPCIKLEKVPGNKSSVFKGVARGGLRGLHELPFCDSSCTYSGRCRE